MQTRKRSSADAFNLSEASLTVCISGDAFLASAEEHNGDAFLASAEGDNGDAF